MGQDPNNPQPGQPQSPYGAGQSGPEFGGSPNHSQPYGSDPAFGSQSPQSAQGFGQPPAGGFGSPPGPPDPYQQPIDHTQVQPVAPGAYPPPGGPGTPAGMPPGAPMAGPPGLPPNAPPPAKRSNKGLMIGLIVGGVALLLVIGLIIALVVARAAGGGGGDSDEPVAADTPSAALQGYLEAVAAGDATKAAEYGMGEVADLPSASAEVLEAAVEAHPITNINVPESDSAGTSAYVDATYTVGDTDVQAYYDMVQSNGEWKLDEVVATSDWPTEFGDLEVEVYGVSIAGDGLAFFPGTYEFTTGSTLLEFDEGSTLTVESPTDTLSFYDMSIDVSAAGKTAVVKGAKAALNKCMASTEMNPSGCGSSFGSRLPSGVTAKAGTVKRSIDTARTPFDKGEVRSSYGDPTVVELDAAYTINLSVTGSDGNYYKGSTYVYGATGTVTGDKMTVVLD